VAEKLMLHSLYLLIDAIGIQRNHLLASEPNLRTALCTNYSARLALWNLPGVQAEISVGRKWVAK
jgi:hypothetical protein